jgi:cytosine/adenosine deaminase-related metal-dependent hydrolase
VIRYRARWVVPIVSEPLRDGVVAVDGDRIAYVGPLGEGPPGDEHDLGDVLLLPGLVNVHTHLELTAMRGFLEDLDFRRWILRLTSARRDVLDANALLDAARFGIEEGLRAGVTSYADTSDSGVVVRAMRDAGVRGVVYQEVFGPDPAQCETSINGLREKIANLRYLETPLVRIGVSPHAPYTVSDQLFRATTELARQHGLPMAIHVAESAAEQRYVSEGDGPFADALRGRGIHVGIRGRSPIDMLDRLGVLDARPLLIHCVRADEGDIAAIARTRCPVAHCPVSNAKLGHGAAPLAEFLGAGVTVGLGSDSVASNNRMDLLEEARFALLTQRSRLGSFETPSASEVLELATLGGAAALGLEEVVGSLEEGKQADLAAFPIAGVAPTTDPITAAVFALGGARASFVAVAGKPLIAEAGARLTNQRPDLAARIQELGDSLADWLDAGGETRR